MKTINWGIIGAGTIAKTFATALSSMENTKLSAVASRDMKRAREFADRFHVEKAYASYEELAKDPGIDVIYIGTPNTEHKANAALCIRNKKAVLCEKPFTLNATESEELISMAREYKVFLMEAMWTKFLPVTDTVKRWITEKRIGEVRHMKISFGFRAEFDLNSRLFNPDLAGGALLDVGIYPITYAIHMMGKLPDQVTSSAVLGRSGVDEQNVITFKFRDGVLADLSSAISAATGNDAVIIGDKGKIIIPDFWMGSRARMYDADNNLIDSFLQPFAVNGYEYEAEEVNRCIREGRPDSRINPLNDTLAIIKLMDQIRAQWGLVYPKEIC